MKRFLLLAALLLASAASAQELAIFDLNDFVDPRELGAVPASFRRFGCPCKTVLVTRVATGWDHEYVNVTRATRTDVGFGHIAASVYRGPWQLNAKATVLRDVHRLVPSDTVVRAFPRNFFVLQLAYYLRGPGSSSLRTQVSWRGTHYHEAAREYFAHELGAEVDTQVSVFGHPIEGSLIYTTLAQAPDGRQLKNSSRLGYVQRFPRLRLGAIRIDPSLTAGLLGEGLKFRSAGRLNVQPKIHASLPLKFGGANLNVIYGPNYQRLAAPPRAQQPQPPIVNPVTFTNGTGAPDFAWQSRNEVAIFIDVPVLLHSR
ncbi:MAG: hypothetical protein AABO58_19330 [Acidobacteriota bacterium]